MFQLHDRTRRNFCIAAFFALCVVPTVVTLGWCIVRHWPGNAAAEARRLGRELGLEVSLGAIEHPSPGVVLYRRLKLSDRETREPLFRCETIEVRWRKEATKRGEDIRALVLSVSQPELLAGSVQKFQPLLSRFLRQQVGAPHLHVRLAAPSAAIHTGGGAMTLRDVCARIDHPLEGTSGRLSFRLADQEKPMRLHIGRNRQVTPPITGFHFDTNSQEIPCELLAVGLKAFDALGPQASFVGQFSARENTSGSADGSAGTSAGASADMVVDPWDGHVVGELRNVDLGLVVGERFPHKLSGTASVGIRSARFRSGRLEEATGSLSAGPGTIGRSLVAASAERLGFVPAVEMSTLDTSVPYERLELLFALSADGVQFQGRCPHLREGTMLSGEHGSLLCAYCGEPAPIVALLQTLVPQREVLVPATLQSDWLMRRLPLPKVEAVDSLPEPARAPLELPQEITEAAPSAPVLPVQIPAAPISSATIPSTTIPPPTMQPGMDR